MNQPIYHLIVHGDPVPHNHRFRVVRTKTGAGWVQSYKKKNLQNWQALIRTKAQGIYRELLEGPLAVTVRIFLSRPKSRPKKYLLPDRKPDWDNVAKSGIDGVKGVLFRDDNQICDAHVFKRYTGNGEAPRIEIEISRMEESE